MTKKRHEDTAWSNIPNTSTRFKDEDAYANYMKIRNNRMIYEKGFQYDWDPKSRYTQGVTDIILGRDWMKFCEHKEVKVNHHWVVEFHANLKRKAKTIWVRGVEVPFNRQVIQEILDVPVKDEKCHFWGQLPILR